MNDSPNIPTPNEEQKLAKELGLRLQGVDHDVDLNDPLISILDEYTEGLPDESQIPQERSEKMWEHIRRSTLRSQEPAVVRPMFTLRRFAVAASILIVAALGIFWSLNTSSSELLLATGDSIEMLELEDGTEVILRPHSKLFSEPESDLRSYRLVGEGLFEVVSDPDLPFQVLTDHGVVEVLGTEFNVSTWGNVTTVYLYEGSVAVRSEATGEVMLEPGQVVSVSSSQRSDVSEADPKMYNDWQNNTIVFSSTGIEEVINELEHHFDIRITITEQVGKSPISGTLRLTSRDQTLEELGLVIGAQFVKLDDDLYRLQPTN